MLSLSLSGLGAAAMLATTARAGTVKSPTPPMGWNSYNAYACTPTEDIVRANAKAMVDLGLAERGYAVVTVDCGWNGAGRLDGAGDGEEGQGAMFWNETLFPSGGKALGDYIHGLGLEFGLYSGAGYFQCGSEVIPASLGYEDIDAQSFAEWGGDTLKYDNCYASSPDQMVDVESPESLSPDRFVRMGEALNATGRDIKYFLCQWGVGENVPEWAAPLGNSWRMSNDIFHNWQSIWRIANQAVPHVKHTTVGAFADLDMLIVGLGALSPAEERFHFGFWSMLKSPLIMGAALAELPSDSLDVMSNEEVIAINQDPLAKAGQLIMRYTEEEWDIWAGELSGDRKVVGIANWRNESQTVQVDFGLVGVSGATTRDPWTAQDGSVSGIEEMDLAPHELRILVLSDIEEAKLPEETSSYNSVQDAIISGNASLNECERGCAPLGQKVVDFTGDSTVTLESVSAPRDGALLVGVDFINHEYHFFEALELGTNTRNMSISVNDGESKRWAFPLSGGDWFETGRLMVELDGFVQGDANSVVFSAPPEGERGPDVVGLQVYDY